MDQNYFEVHIHLKSQDWQAFYIPAGHNIAYASVTSLDTLMMNQIRQLFNLGRKEHIFLMKLSA